ncbi:MULTISPECIES: DNA adenine methylase [unclassified Pseudomonas]|uniref:DNA adenine methylase n=1 Tax=unclassified Pseudomonas TaxID=196821 RepID=UPI0009E0A29D|nr:MULTISPECIES: DNA adenine methylase [unclassified Pseudomonas]SME95209.1 Adenine-specific DNA methylase [Pseudomonas sp. LAMO17WK12:I1]
MFRYFGSKASTASLVADLALDGMGLATAADAFGGLGNIGAEFKKRGCAVTTCDVLSFPNAFQHVRISCMSEPDFSYLKRKLGVSHNNELLMQLNNTVSTSPWFVREYSSKRAFFTAGNAAKIGGAWRQIGIWKKMQWINLNEEKYLVASLLNSMDSVANTAGTYYAYLKEWDRKSLRNFSFQWFDGVTDGIPGTAVQADALSYLSGKSFDVLYLDPPYNNRDYSRYYHLPETLAKLKPVKIDGASKSGLPLVRPSEGKEIRDAMKLPYLLELINSVCWSRLVLQYADGAYISICDLEKALSQLGSLRIHQVSALGYQSTNGTRQQVHHVFVIDK